MNRPDRPAEALGSIVPLPRGTDGEPAFAAPWQAQAFAMAVDLHGKGLFTWSEWAEALGREIAKEETRGASALGYYECWLTALEALVARKGLASSFDLDERRSAFERAAKATPHGEPVLLGNDPLRRA